MTPYELPLRQALDAADEIIFMTDRDGLFTFVNRAFERLYGYAAPEVVGRCTPSLLKSGQTAPDVYATWWTRLKRGEALRERFVNRTRDGRLIDVEVSVTAVRSDLQEVVGFLAVQRDITLEEQAKLALKHSEARCRALADTAPDAIFIADADNRFEYLNEAAIRYLGASAASSIGRRIEECFGLEVGARLVAQLEQARSSPAPVYEEQEITFPMGTRWVGTWLQSIGAGTVGPRSVMGIARDMTTQHEMATLLERQNRLLSAIIDTSPIGILLVNAESWVCDIANPAARDLGAAHLASGTRLADGWPEATAQLVPLIEQAMRSGSSVVSAELELPEALRPHSVAARRRLTASASLLHLPSRMASVLVMLTDVTDRLGLEQQLLQAQKMEAVGRLAGGIAHDFNNLLTPILGYADLIMATLAPDDRRRKDVDEVCRAAKSAAALTRQLLTFSRKQVTDPTILSLNAVLVEVEAMLRRSIGEDVDVIQRHGPDLGYVRVDRNQIEQVVMNLSVNARDAMPHGGVLTIATTTATLTTPVPAMPERVPPGNYVVLSIADTGAGMTPEVLAHLFEPFYTTKEFGKGTGLGLSTVLGIVSESGGHIAVKSAPQQGTTFTIYLPRVSAEALPRAEPPSSGPVDLPAGHETILIVEDNEGLRHLAERVLTDLGYTTLAEANADEALRTLHEYRGPIHLLLTDIVMPGANGVTLANRVACRRPETRVLFMSGYSSRDLADRQTQMNGRKLLQKPFTRLTLARAVREALDVRAAHPVRVA